MGTLVIIALAVLFAIVLWAKVAKLVIKLAITAALVLALYPTVKDMNWKAEASKAKTKVVKLVKENVR